MLVRRWYKPAMYPWLRLLRACLPAGIQPKVDPLTVTRVRLRIWPNDLDFNFHVNNGRYLTLADIGRLHWFVRSGVLAAARRQRALPVVGDAIAKFRRDLRLFDVFEIHTRLLGWDSRWGFIEHRFMRRGRVIGAVMVRGVFKGPQGVMAPATLLAGIAPGLASPQLPDWALRFDEAAELHSGLLREEERAQGLRP